MFGVTIHASKDRNGSSWVREPPNLLLSVFGRTGPAEKVPRAGGLQDRTEGSCNPTGRVSSSPATASQAVRRGGRGSSW